MSSSEAPSSDDRDDAARDAWTRSVSDASDAGESIDGDSDATLHVAGRGNPAERLPESDVSNEDDDDLARTTNVPRKRRVRRKKTPTPLGVCLVNCKYPLLHDMCKRLGYSPVEEDGDWCLFWTDTSVAIERVMRLKKTQRINHFVGMLEICRKKALARNLARLTTRLPGTFNFAPQSFVLPEELEAFMDVVKSNKPKTGGKKTQTKTKTKTYILKPDAGCQGKGICLVQTEAQAIAALRELGVLGPDGASVKNPNHVKKSQAATLNVVAQRYVADPFLIDGRKFDLRVYALVTDADPLRVFVYNDGLVRFCTTKYVPPETGNLKNSQMHLTNYAVNKNAENFVRAEDVGKSLPKPKTPAQRARALLGDEAESPEPGFGSFENPEVETLGNPNLVGDGGVASKWSVQNGLRPWCLSNGVDFAEVWDSVSDVCVKTVIAAAPLLRHNYRNAMRQMESFDGVGTDKEEKDGNAADAGGGSLCFEVLGIDVMLDVELKPWLVEVNHSPSFATDSTLDLRVKQNLIKDTIALIGLNEKAIRRRKTAEQNDARARLGVPETTVLAPKGGGDNRGKKSKEKEKSPGAYQLVFPSPDCGTQESYEACLRAASHDFERFGQHAKARDALRVASQASKLRGAEALVKSLFHERGFACPLGDRFKRCVEKALAAREKTGADVAWEEVDPNATRGNGAQKRAKRRSRSQTAKVVQTEQLAGACSDDLSVSDPEGIRHGIPIVPTVPVSLTRVSMFGHVQKQPRKPRPAAPAIINLQGDAIRVLMGSRALEAKAAMATAQAKRIGTLSLGARHARDAVRRFAQKTEKEKAPRSDFGISPRDSVRPKNVSRTQRVSHDGPPSQANTEGSSCFDGFGLGLVGSRLR